MRKFFFLHRGVFLQMPQFFDDLLRGVVGVRRLQSQSSVSDFSSGKFTELGEDTEYFEKPVVRFFSTNEFRDYGEERLFFEFLFCAGRCFFLSVALVEVSFSLPVSLSSFLLCSALNVLLMVFQDLNEILQASSRQDNRVDDKVF